VLESQNKTLYIIDKVVRKKLQKDKIRRVSSAKSPDKIKFTLSPRDNIPREEVKEKVKKSRKSSEEDSKTPKKQVIEVDLPKISYDEWYQMKEVYK